ncbi:MAG: hypothetical protein LBS09_00250 [Bacteroidales bacterium]|jgi:hypothetical protein|nr:hypothetical protein [Bacteroidales bacterium]
MKADTGTISYIIIALIAILGGILEKYLKAKKQQEMKRQQPFPDDVEEAGTVTEFPSGRQVMRQEESYEGYETFEAEEAELYETVMPHAESPATVPEVSEYAVSSNTVFVASILNEQERAFYAIPAGAEANAGENVAPEGSYDFDIRQAVIANEILNRKYQ